MMMLANFFASDMGQFMAELFVFIGAIYVFIPPIFVRRKIKTHSAELHPDLPEHEAAPLKSQIQRLRITGRVVIVVGILFVLLGFWALSKTKGA